MAGTRYFLLCVTAILMWNVRSLDWNYNKGGEDWNFSWCNDTASQQSPIVVKTGETRPFTPPFYLFPRLKQPLQMRYLNYGWTFRLAGFCGYMYTIEPFSIVHGLTFGCNYIEFHAPAEHRFDDPKTAHPLEMQVYMSLINGNAVPKLTDSAFSFFFRLGNHDNPFLAQFLGKITTNETLVDVSLEDIFPIDAGSRYQIYSYRGSYTHPTCEPNINWYLILPPLEISARQLKIFNDLWKDNPTFAAGHGNNRNAFLQNSTVFRYP